MHRGQSVVSLISANSQKAEIKTCDYKYSTVHIVPTNLDLRVVGVGRCLHGEIFPGLMQGHFPHSFAVYLMFPPLELVLSQGLHSYSLMENVS